MRAVLILSAAIGAAAAAAHGETLGQIDPNYEPHDELVVASGQLTGFAEACGFGRKPDRVEMLRWYMRHQLARNIDRIETLYDLGITLGREVPCTVDENLRLVRHWEAVMLRTEAFVRTYRAPPQPPPRSAGTDPPSQSGSTGP